MSIRLRCATFALALVAGSGVAVAQTPPVIDMKGTWKITVDLVIDGTSPHNPAQAESKAAGKFRLRSQVIVFKLEGQDGRRFWGTVTSEHDPGQRAVGTVSPDGKWVYLVGRVNLGDGMVIDADTIQMCFRHAGETSAMAGCGETKRQK